MSEPNEFPFGQTETHNFDPEQVNTAEDVVEVLDWIIEENDKLGETKAADVFRDAQTLVRVCLVEDTNE